MHWRKYLKNLNSGRIIEKLGTYVQFMGDDYGAWLEENQAQMDKVAEESGMKNDI